MTVSNCLLFQEYKQYFFAVTGPMCKYVCSLISLLSAVSVQEYDELVEMQAKLEEKLQELEANPPR